jgi:alkylhydroperoxidase family enzyme
MAMLSYVDEASMSDDVRAQFQRLPINLIRMLLHAPRTASGFLDMAIGFRHGVLDPQLRETVILRVATDQDNLYQRMQHLPAAVLAGLSCEEVDAITRGDLIRLDPRLAIAVRFVDECVARIRVSDLTFEDAQQVFSPSELVEMNLLIGFYMMTARFLATFAIDLDAQPVDWRRADVLEAVPCKLPSEYVARVNPRHSGGYGRIDADRRSGGGADDAAGAQRRRLREPPATDLTVGTGGERDLRRRTGSA